MRDMVDDDHILPFSFVRNVALIKKANGPDLKIEQYVTGFVTAITHRLEGANESDGGETKLCAVLFTKEELESKVMLRFTQLMKRSAFKVKDGGKMFLFWADPKNTFVGVKNED